MIEGDRVYRRRVTAENSYTDWLPSLNLRYEASDNLIVRAAGGQVLATGADSLSYEYLYTAEITVLDYAGHADALFVPLVAWLRVNQSDALDNADKRQKALLFDVEQLNDTAADVGIRVPLREAVIVNPAPDPPFPPCATCGHRIYNMSSCIALSVCL